MIKNIEAIIVDDEEANIELLSLYLNKCCPFVTLIGEADSVDSAVKLINKLKPKLLFLDIILGEGTGFDILEKISSDDFKVIFVSSHDEFAIKAFKYSAIDYILKPIDQKELFYAVKKCLSDIEKDDFTSNQQIELLNVAVKKNTALNFLAIPSINKIEFIKLEDIIYLKSDGRYTNFFLTNERKIIASRNLGEYENILDKSIFFRIHNSYIVNLTHVEIITKTDGSYCEMSNHESLPIAKRRQDSLSRFLRIK